MIKINQRNLWIWDLARWRGQPPAQRPSPGARRGPPAVVPKSTGGEDILTNVLTLIFLFPFAFPVMTGRYLLGRAGSNVLNCWRKFSQLIKLLCVLCWSKILFMSYVSGSTKEWMGKKKSYSSVLIDNEMMIGEIMPWLYCQHNVSEGNSIGRVHSEILIPNPDH